jgi:hypothetical protein
MKLPKLKDCGDDIVRASRIKMLAPQKLAAFLMKHKGILVRFKATLDILLLLDSNSSKNVKGCSSRSARNGSGRQLFCCRIALCE